MKKIIIMLICTLFPINVYALTDVDCYELSGLIFAKRQCAADNNLEPRNVLSDINFSQSILDECNKNNHWAFTESSKMTKELKRDYSCSQILNAYMAVARKNGVMIGGYQKLEEDGDDEPNLKNKPSKKESETKDKPSKPIFKSKKMVIKGSYASGGTDGYTYFRVEGDENTYCIYDLWTKPEAEKILHQLTIDCSSWEKQVCEIEVIVSTVDNGDPVCDRMIDDIISIKKIDKK